MKQKLQELGYFEIDYNKPYSEQIEVGDVVIDTYMSAYFCRIEEFGLQDDAEEKLLKDEEENIIVKLERLNYPIRNCDIGIVSYFVIKNIMNKDEEPEYLYIPEGRIFVKKAKLEYETVQVPKHLVDYFVSLGAKKSELKFIDTKYGKQIETCYLRDNEQCDMECGTWCGYFKMVKDMTE